MKMAPAPTSIMLPPVMDTIYKKKKVRKDSRDQPAYVIDVCRQKSSSLTNLFLEVNSEDVIVKQAKSNSFINIQGLSDDEVDLNHNKLKYPDYNHKKKEEIENIFDYDNMLREERKEFHFRLRNTPQATGKLEDFIVLKKLGYGQFGKVYLVQDFIERKNYALKAISKEVILRNNLGRDVETERDYLYAANSPFIVSLVHHFQDAQRVYFVQEYISGGDIYENLKNHGPFSEELTRFYTAQVVLALEYLHDVGDLIYRDLKPENLMIDSRGYVKLVDFGFVKRVVGKTNTMVGTPAYMAPEMVYHKSYDKTIDWWSLGILVYEMLAGCQVTPFYDSNRMTMYMKITTKEVTFPNRFPRSTVRDLIKRLLKVNPAIRLGCGFNGSKDVKNHPWFASIKWDDLYNRIITPPAKPSNFNCRNNFPNAKYQKVAALKQSLLGGGSTRAPDTIQNRVRLERLMKMI